MSNTKMMNITLLLTALTAVLLPITSHSASLGEIYIISSDPLFAEVPVCNPGPNGTRFSVELTTDEQINEEGIQPFATQVTQSLESYDAIEGLISISAQDKAPDGVSLIVTLLDENNQTADSVLYNDLQLIRPSPDDFGCVAIVEDIEVIEEVVEEDGEFIIDIVTGDTWRNIAEMVNIAWYDQRYPIEQVMLGLFKYNNNGVLNISPHALYPLPDQLLIPEETYPSTISIGQLLLASHLDFQGIFEVKSTRSSGDSTKLTQLREEFALLQERLDGLSQRLIDSQALIQLKDTEVDKLRKNLLETRKRISVLEKENQELANKSFLTSINDSIREFPLAWILVFLAVFGLAVWFGIRLTNQKNKKEMTHLRNSAFQSTQKKK